VCSETNPYGREPERGASPGRKEGGAPINSESQNRSERRNAIRYRMGVPASYRWSGREKKRSSSAGTVRDMSLEGIFILSPVCPLIGTKVDIEIGRSRLRERQRRFIKARMKVVRIERNESAAGFAACGKVFIGGERRRGAGGNASAPMIAKGRRDGQELRMRADKISALVARALASMSKRTLA
jgi:hypothetical protein